MADILSNSELDDLLSSVNTGTDMGEDVAADRRVSTYDFSRPSRLTRDHIHVLQPLNRSVADGLSGQLSELLRSSVEVNAIGIDAIPCANFINSLPSTICLNIFSLGDVVEKGLLTMDVPLALAMVDRLLGGPGVAIESLRALTDIEDKVIDLPTKITLEHLTKHWSAIAPVNFKFEERRMDPKTIQIAPPSEVVLRTIFAVGGQIGSGELIFVVPFSAIDKMMPRELMKERFYRSTHVATDIEKAVLNSRIRTAPVKLSAILGETELTLGELSSLRTGHVLPLTKRVSKPLDLLVQGVPKFKVRPGRYGRTLSVQVCEVIERAKPIVAEEPAAE